MIAGRINIGGVSNIEDLETYCKNFLKLNGYSK